MHNVHRSFSFSPVSLGLGLVGVLVVSYIGLIAVVMSYAAMTVSFSQSVKDDEATVALLESQYLAGIASIENVDYRAAGYATPAVIHFVPTVSMTAIR